MHDADLYGYSVFETFLADRGTFWCLPGHWRRLCSGSRYLAMDPPTFDAFLEAITTNHNPEKREVIRVTLRREGGHWSGTPCTSRLHVAARPFIATPDPVLRIQSAQRALPSRDPLRRFKTGSRLAYQHGYTLARRMDYDDCLFYDTRDHLLETAMANLFLLIAGSWYTPPLTDCVLPGTMRGYLLRQGYGKTAILTREDLGRADAAVLSNSVHGCRPVAKIDTSEFSVSLGRAWIRSQRPRAFQPYP